VGECEKYIQTLALNAGPEFNLLIYSPEAKTLQEASSPKRPLMQRYALLEKVKSEDTQVLGILIGSVVVEGYLEIIANIKLTAARAGKKTYEVLIGKLNEPKLKNFQFVSLLTL
jgi:diphthamide biosynthesis enzyme Dph1/Dph2-like protein